MAISHGYQYKLFSEFLCKNESTTLVIKMDEQQVLKSIVNNFKTSDPTIRMIFWCLCFREFSQLAHIGQAPPLTSHTSLSRCRWQRTSLTGSPLLLHSIEISAERTQCFQVITPSSRGEILRTGVEIVSVTQSIPCLQGRCGRPPSSRLPLGGYMDW